MSNSVTAKLVHRTRCKDNRVQQMIGHRGHPIDNAYGNFADTQQIEGAEHDAHEKMMAPFCESRLAATATPKRCLAIHNITGGESGYVTILRTEDNEHCIRNAGGADTKGKSMIAVRTTGEPGQLVSDIPVAPE